MWKWIKNIIRTLLGMNKIIPALPAKQNNDILVKLQDKQESNIIDIDKFKNNIYKAHKEGSSETELIKCINKIITEEIPYEYKRALEYGGKIIYIHKFSFKGNNYLLNKGFPILAAELAKLGIYGVSFPYGISIHIDVESITKATTNWDNQNSSIIKIQTK